MEQMKKDVITKWSESAKYWEKYRETIREMFAPVTDALIQDARIAKGHAVLDVAMGPGEPALSIADVVGPAGRVVGTDAVAEMVEAARREAARRGMENAEFETAVAERLPFGDDSFDAAVSRFGVMFFPSPVAGVREMLRVVKPGGRVVMAAWHVAERNPFHWVLANVVDRYVPSPATEPGAPEMFRFATHGELLGVFADAGAKSRSERLLRFSITGKLTPEEYWKLRSEMSETLRSKLSQLSEERLEELKREAVEAIRGYSSGEWVSFPGEVWIVSGEKGLG
jgi:ubiquinone/menaquinone biosynthesis C-methylase UbiE